MTYTNAAYVKNIRKEPPKQAQDGFKRVGNAGVVKHIWTRSNGLKWQNTVLGASYV